MSKREDKSKLKSPAKTEISGALDDKDLKKVTGGDKARVPTEQLSLSFGKPEFKYREQ
jgi:hypothetical protein